MRTSEQRLFLYSALSSGLSGILYEKMPDVQNMFIRCLSLSVGYLVLETKLDNGILSQICRTGASLMEIGLVTTLFHVRDKNKFLPILSIFLK